MTHLYYEGADGTPLYACRLDVGRFEPSEHLPTLVLLHGGGPDHQSLAPLGGALTDHCSVILPDIRGYGRSVCSEPKAHTWSHYASDVIRLLDDLDLERAIIGGAGLGGTIAVRTALAYPERVAALVLISVEDIEDDAAKVAEIAFMEAFASRAREEGLAAAWAPILPDLAPVIRAMVEDAIPRSNATSIAAAAAIGQDRSFLSPDEFRAIQCPALIVAGMDWRHPPELAAHLAGLMPHGRLAPDALSAGVTTASEFADALGSVIRDFLSDLAGRAPAPSAPHES